MEQSLLIRDAIDVDCESMASIAARAWHFAYGGFLSEGELGSLNDLSRRTEGIRKSLRDPGSRLVAVMGSGEIVGFASERSPGSYEDCHAEIAAIYVDPDFTRTGAGSCLVCEMCRRFVQSGHQSLAIRSFSENTIGSTFYTKLGGKPVPGQPWNDHPCTWFVWNDIPSLHQRLKASTRYRIEGG